MQFRNLYLDMQAHNLAVVDGFLNELKKRVLRQCVEENRTPLDSAIFFNPQSQIWIFAANE